MQRKPSPITSNTLGGIRLRRTARQALECSPRLMQWLGLSPVGG
jgi:hypothetical protein